MPISGTHCRFRVTSQFVDTPSASVSPATDDAALKLFEAARISLFEVLNGDTRRDAPSSGGTVVTLTVYLDGELRASQWGRGATAVDATRDAAYRAANDRRFAAPIPASAVTSLRLELWIRTSREQLGNPRDIGQIDLGLDGVEFRLDDHYAE